MPLIDAQGRVLGRFNCLDAGLVALLSVSVLGILLVQTGIHATSKNMIEGETDIEIGLYLRTRTDDPTLFKVGSQPNITIRNQPRGKMLITAVSFSPAKALVPQASGYKVIDDPQLQHVYDFKLTLKDHALVTPEGFVAEGVKVKVGLPIELEDQTYRLTGGITKVVALTNSIPEAHNVSH
jgi:hypothetical protein